MSKSKALIVVGAFSFLGYCTKVAMHPYVLPSHPYPSYITSSQINNGAEDHSSRLNRYYITTPLSSSSSSTPTSSSVPTAKDFTHAMFSSWVLFLERIAVNTYFLSNPLELVPVEKGNKLIHVFHVDSASEDSVELTWRAFGFKGTHFLRREIRNRADADAENAKYATTRATNAGMNARDAGTNAGDSLVVTWRFETLMWSNTNKDSPMASFTGRMLSIFHEVYARMLLSSAVSKLGY